ncbi:dnaJ homolog subfamily C member 2 isoform X2 [Patella vulgata]|uniref:dnaJ homolog subfamily C member 2 isoform X2 n=1 Tax=Patella vulgata TaxID=6465 RepID=UPI0024A80C36|nr:dnaJ homolog subfamily C member 2 isoform X2 [Patella vulgata]
MAVTATDPPSILPGANEGETTMVVKKLSAPLTQKVEPVGRWYEAYQNRLHSKHSVSQHSVESSSSDESEDDTEIEDNTQFLMSLDPKDWKNQDHYIVLGLEKLRYKATEDQIKKAYKRQVLHHHPDKRKARGLNVKEGDDDYFTCITRAWETLGVPAKRRSFDSVDPEFDDDVPSNNALAKEKFYKVFRPIFEMNARWSKKPKVPELGDENTPYDDVDDFYGFWYDFDSWREFSYLDEEEKEKGENRDERRWIEKQNKAARQKRKKEETSRIRQLVDNAYACDPRVIKFKEDEKAKKIAMKKAKQDAIKQRQEAEEKQRRDAEEEERLVKQKEADEIKARAEVAKKEREEQDKAFKREKKLLMASAKEKNYFASNDDERVKNILDVDKLARLLSLVSLKELNEKITSSDDESAKAAYLCEVKAMNAKLEEEKRKQIQALHKKKGSDGSKSLKDWPDVELQFLIKAVNLFPAGTQDSYKKKAYQKGFSGGISEWGNIGT